MISTQPKSPTAGLLSLADPKNINAAIEEERRAKAKPGWLGITVKARCDDWQLCLRHGVQQVEVDPRSSPYRDAGMRNNDFFKSIQIDGAPEITLDEFDSLTPPPPVGSKAIIRFYRRGTGRASGWLLGAATLTAPPRILATPEWKKSPAVPCGRRVRKEDRPKFIAAVSKRRDFTSAMVRAITVLLFNFDNAGREGFWPSYATMAEAFGCSRPYAIELVKRLQWVGVIKLVEGPMSIRPTNLFMITWPGTPRQPTIWA